MKLQYYSCRTVQCPENGRVEILPKALRPKRWGCWDERRIENRCTTAWHAWRGGAASSNCWYRAIPRHIWGDAWLLTRRFGPWLALWMALCYIKLACRSVMTLPLYQSYLPEQAWQTLLQIHARQGKFCFLYDAFHIQRQYTMDNTNSNDIKMIEKNENKIGKINEMMTKT